MDTKEEKMVIEIKRRQINDDRVFVKKNLQISKQKTYIIYINIDIS